MIITNLPTLFLPVLLLASSVMAMSACDRNSDSGRTKSTSSQAKSEHTVATTSARVQSVQNQLTISGTVEAGTKVRLYNEVSARIQYLPYHEGDFVPKQTVVIGLDDDIIQAELDKATATRKQAKIDYDRLRKLQKQLASDEEIARAGTAYEIAVADEQLYRKRLDKTTIEAPFDGILTERHYEPGDAVPVHSHIMTMIDPESLQVTIYLAENWIHQIAVGDRVDIQIDALTNSLHPGLISRIHPTIDADTRKGTVEIEFQPVPFGARAGQLARVHLKTRPSNRLVIPAHALHHDGKGAYVYVVDQDSTTLKTYVSKGSQYGNAIEITQGIKQDDSIVTKGFNGLRDGKKVKVLDADGSGVAESS